MKIFFLFFLVIKPFHAYSELYVLDPSHSHVGFKIKHLGISTVRGEFDSFKGTGEIDPITKDINAIQMKIETASINTKVEKRDSHLRNEDFFHVSKYPEIIFTSKKISYDDKTKVPLQIVGDLNIRGVTKSITLTVEWGGATTDPWGNKKIGFEATGQFERDDFGLTWNKPINKIGGLTVGNTVKLEIQVEAVKKELKKKKPKEQIELKEKKKEEKETKKDKKEQRGSEPPKKASSPPS